MSNPSHSTSSSNEHNRSLLTVETLVTKWKEEGNTFYHDKNYASAIGKYTTIINLLKLQHALFSPNVSIDERLKLNLLNILYISYSNRCACYLQKNELSAAHQDAKECISLKPDWSKGYYRLVSCLTRLEKYDDAIAVYYQLLAIEPESKHAEILKEIENTERKKNGLPANSSSSSSSSSRAAPSAPPAPAHSSSSAYNPTSSSNGASSHHRQQHPLTGHSEFSFSDIWHKIQRFFASVYSTFLQWYFTLSEEYRTYLKYGLVAFVLYYFFFYSSFFGSSSYSSSRASPSRYPTSSRRGYNDDYDYSHYSRGMSWTTWIMIIGGAYAIPPLLPQVLGPQFARPFFGLNFTTFLWLLNLFSNSGGFGGGGYGGRRRRYF
jgi:tetratricopeptide (TPR) repeat protein